MLRWRLTGWCVMLTASRECQHEQVHHGSRLLPQAFKRAACEMHDGTGGPLLPWHCFGIASQAAQPGLCLESSGQPLKLWRKGLQAEGK